MRLRQVIAAAAAITLVVVAPAPARADETRDKQWYLASLDVAAAQRITTGDGVLVAVIDTGVDGDHPDLKGAVAGGVDTVSPRGELFDDSGHGTAMAGIIAARGRSGDRGLIGIAPAARILAVRPADDSFYAVKGIEWAVEHKAKVINMSFALPDSEQLHAAIRSAAAKNVVLVSSVGNSGDKGNKPEFPGAYPEVLGVGATDRQGKVAKLSQHGDQVDIVAPGVDIETANVGVGYRTGFGSSNSAAIVSGAAALIRAKYPDLTAPQVIDRLIATADDKGDKGRDDFYGNGALNLVKALTAPQPSAAAPTGLPAAAPPVASSIDTSGGGIPPLVFVGAGLLLLVVVIFAVVMAVRRSRAA